MRVIHKASPATIAVIEPTSKPIGESLSVAEKALNAIVARVIFPENRAVVAAASRVTARHATIATFATPCATAKILVLIAAAFTAIVYATIEAVTTIISPLYLPIKVISELITLRMSVVDEITCFITGASFSPSSTASSVNLLRALSSPACTVVFCTLNSFVTEVASWKALLASSCCQRTVSTLPARAEITADALAPSSPISLNTGARTSIPPSSCNRSSNIKSPSLVELSKVALNFSRSRPVACAILSVSLNKSMISFDNAVADISTAWPCESSTAANAISCGIVIPACAPTPASRCENWARYGADAVQFCDSSLITEPTASKERSVPSLASSPKMFVSLESVSVAPSPRSSRATFIWSAAFTNPSTSSCEVLPRRPASCASRLRSSREVRVSIF